MCSDMYKAETYKVASVFIIKKRLMLENSVPVLTLIRQMNLDQICFFRNHKVALGLLNTQVLCKGITVGRNA